MPAAHTREEAIRQARRLGDPAAVCAALAVTSAWEADEARGLELAGRFVEEGLLTEEQVRGLLQAEPLFATATAPAHALDWQLAPEPAPAAVAVLEIAEPVPVEELAPAVDPPPAVSARPIETTPQPTEIGAAEAPTRETVVPIVEPRAVERPVRRPWRAAAFLGVAVAISLWVSLGATRPQPPARPRTPEPQSAPFLVAPLPPAPRPPRPPGWAPELRQVRKGDSFAIHDRLRALQTQILADPGAVGVSFDAHRLLARAPRKDRILRWVELSLGRFHAVADLRTESVDVAWARE